MNNALAIRWAEIRRLLSVDPYWSQAERYLTRAELVEGISIRRLWNLLDMAWDEMLGIRKAPSDLPSFLYRYYQHPVWLINAAFSESDVETINDRLAAVRLVTHVQPRRLLDFGGGIGTVSRLCAQCIPSAESIDLLDITPFRQTSSRYLSEFPSIRINEKPNPPYDAVIATEVLEHLIDPVGAVIEINRLLRIGGAFSASWSFAPIIKCHLPQNFHLRRSMLWIIRSLGFGFYGFERRGSLVHSFIKHSEIKESMIRRARLLESLSRMALPLGRLLLLVRGM